MSTLNRECELTTSTGTGTLVLSGTPPTGYRTMGTDRIFPYLIEAVDSLGNPTGQWETGLGWVNNSTRVFTRNLSNWGDGSTATPVDFAPGTKRVWACVNDIMLYPWIAIGRRTTTLALSSANTANRAVTLMSIDHFAVEFATLVTGNIAVNTTNTPTYPDAWCDLVDIIARVEMSGLSAGEWVQMTIQQGGFYENDTLTVVDPVATGRHIIQLRTAIPLFVSPSAPNFGIAIRTETTAAPNVTKAIMSVRGYPGY